MITTRIIFTWKFPNYFTSHILSTQATEESIVANLTIYDYYCCYSNAYKEASGWGRGGSSNVLHGDGQYTKVERRAVLMQGTDLLFMPSTHCLIGLAIQYYRIFHAIHHNAIRHDHILIIN